MQRILVLSPHPDDAVWSLGGLLKQWHNQYAVTVVSLFDGDPQAQAKQQIKNQQHKWRQFTDAKFRRNEDNKAMKTLGCQHLSLGYADAALRLSGQQFSYLTLAELFVDVDELASLSIPHGLTESIANLVKPDDIVIAPLGIGGHVDHLLTTKIAKTLANPVGWYAEFPYARGHNIQNISQHCSRLELDTQVQQFDCHWPTWLSGAMAYSSQVLRLFGKRQLFIEQLGEFVHQDNDNACCCIWRTPALNFATDPSSASNKGKA